MLCPDWRAGSPTHFTRFAPEAPALPLRNPHSLPAPADRCDANDVRMPSVSATVLAQRPAAMHRSDTSRCTLVSHRARRRSQKTARRARCGFYAIASRRRNVPACNTRGDVIPKNSSRQNTRRLSRPPNGGRRGHSSEHADRAWPALNTAAAFYHQGAAAHMVAA
jgi:hypothetical protein